MTSPSSFSPTQDALGKGIQDVRIQFAPNRTFIGLQTFNASDEALPAIAGIPAFFVPNLQACACPSPIFPVFNDVERSQPCASASAVCYHRLTAGRLLSARNRREQFVPVNAGSVLFNVHNFTNRRKMIEKALRFRTPAATGFDLSVRRSNDCALCVTRSPETAQPSLSLYLSAIPLPQTADILNGLPLSPMISVVVPIFSPQQDFNLGTPAPITGGLACHLTFISLLKVDLAVPMTVEVVITSRPSNSNIDLAAYNLPGLDPSIYTFIVRGGIVESVGFGETAPHLRPRAPSHTRSLTISQPLFGVYITGDRKASGLDSYKRELSFSVAGSDFDVAVRRRLATSARQALDCRKRPLRIHACSEHMRKNPSADLSDR